MGLCVHIHFIGFIYTHTWAHAHTHTLLVLFLWRTLTKTHLWQYKHFQGGFRDNLWIKLLKLKQMFPVHPIEVVPWVRGYWNCWLALTTLSPSPKTRSSEWAPSGGTAQKSGSLPVFPVFHLTNHIWELHLSGLTEGTRNQGFALVSEIPSP